jgi:hypothetical protein
LNSRTLLATIAGVCLAAGSAYAAGEKVYKPQDMDAEASTVFVSGSGTDRRMDNLEFVGATNGFVSKDFLVWSDGFLCSNDRDGNPDPTLYDWDDEINRDVTVAGGVYDGNPDRADAATEYDNEGSATARLNEVFGSFSHDGGTTNYKNQHWLIDGEDGGFYYLDLLLSADGSLTIAGDSDDTTLELAILERGGNSDFNVYGITAYDGVSVNDADLTTALFVDRADDEGAFDDAFSGDNLNTLEIGSAQKVAAYGISIDSDWGPIVGIRIENTTPGFKGPDIISVAAIPEFNSCALFGGLLGLGGLALRRRSR